MSPTISFSFGPSPAFIDYMPQQLMLLSFLSAHLVHAAVGSCLHGTHMTFIPDSHDLCHGQPEFGI